jgi:acyl dehydratase
MEVGLIPADASAGLNYGLDKVRFITPVRAGARVRSRIVLREVERKAKGRVIVKTSNELQIEGEDKPALIAETLALLVT